MISCQFQKNVSDGKKSFWVEPGKHCDTFGMLSDS